MSSEILSLNLDTRVTRGDFTESLHAVHAVVVRTSGETVAVARDPDLVTFWRSCAKPFQVMPFLDSGGFDSLGWGKRELAIACGSHGGEPEHVSLATEMLGSIGLEQGDLACGGHEPLSPRGAKLLRDSGHLPTRLHNNCSGKHAAMLARAKTAGWSGAGYERVGHPVQDSCLESIADWTEVPVANIPIAVDGCGVVVVALPLRAMALSYAKLGDAAARGEESPARIVDALRSHPHLMGGTERFDTTLIEETEGRVLAKVGAEGVHSFCVPDLGIGGAIKVADGAPRSQYSAMINLLVALGAIQQLTPRLEALLRRPLRNSRGEVVGGVLPVAVAAVPARSA